MANDWKSYADQYLGAMAGDVKTALGNINPNFDWSNAIKDAGTRYAALDGGLDPNRTPSTVLMQQIALAARDQNPQMPADYWNTIYNNLDPQRVSQAAAIQEWQSKQGDDGFLGLGDLGTILALAGSVYGLGTLGGLWGGGTAAGAAGAGALEAAALTGSGIGAIGPGVALGSSLAGVSGLGALADLPWGVNQRGGMDYSDFLSEFGFSPDTLPSLPELGPVTNLQDMITKLDSTPAGKDWLNKMIGGASDAAGSTSLISKLLGSNTGASMLTKLLPSALGLLGSSQQNKALEELVGTQGANRDALLAFGAPYRQRLAGLYDNPSAYLNSPEVQIPVQQGTNAMARALSTQGNPIGNGTALQELQNYSANQLFGRLGQEKDRLAGFGGLTAYNQAGAQQFGNTQAQQALAQGQGNMWNSLGYGLNQVLNPQPTMADLARQFGFGIQGLV